MSKIINSIKLTPVFVPFKKFVENTMRSSEGGDGMAIPSEEPWQGGEAVVCQLISNDGNIGLGEVLVWLPESGISPKQIITAIEEELYKYVLGQSPFDVETIKYRMDVNVARTEIAKGLLDMACYDLMGKIAERPSHDFMGGKCADVIPLCALVPLADVKTMTYLSRSYSRGGYKTVRYKLGRNIDEDIEISQKIREIVGPDIRLRIDYNQAYRPNKAVRAIKAIEPYGIDLVEQPSNKNDYIGLAYVQKRVDTPVMTHEGSFSVTDYVSLVELGAIRILGLNGERPGGITNAIRLISYAELKGLDVVLHSQSLGIGSAAQVHLAAAKFNSLGHSPEIFGEVMLEDDLIKEPLKYNKGTVKVPEGPGWGVELDENALEKYKTSPTITIEK